VSYHNTKLKMRGHCSPALKRSWRVVLQDSKTQWPRRYGTVAESPSLTTPPSALDEALAATSLKNTWTKDEIKQIYETPLMKLAYASVSLLWSAILLLHAFDICLK
jgi:biotin synthase